MTRTHQTFRRAVAVYRLRFLSEKYGIDPDEWRRDASVGSDASTTGRVGRLPVGDTLVGRRETRSDVATPSVRAVKRTDRPVIPSRRAIGPRSARDVVRTEPAFTWVAGAESVLTPGYPTSYLPAETARWSTITQIYEGTNQIQRMVMARQLLKG